MALRCDSADSAYFGQARCQHWIHCIGLAAMRRFGQLVGYAGVPDSSEVRLWLLRFCQAASQSCITSITIQPE